MTMPLPQYIDSGIRDVMLDKFPGGMKELAAKAQLPYMTVVNVFKTSKHVTLKAWIDIAAKLGQNPDKMACIFDSADKKAALLKFTRAESIVSLTEDLEPSDRTYIYSLVRGISGARIKTTYMPIAKALKMSLVDLYSDLSNE